MAPANSQPEANAAATSSASNPSGTRPLIEIGWIIAGKLEKVDQTAVDRARNECQQWLQERFPEFEWQMPVVDREDIVLAPRVESVELLDYGVTERNLWHWDFALIVTAADLVCHYKNDAFSVVSRAMQAAVISTLRIDPRAYDPHTPEEDRILQMAIRIRSLVIHLVGHLAGLEHDEASDSFMGSFETVEDLDNAEKLSPELTDELRQGLHEVADRRLEEESDVARMWSARFYLEASWINRRQIVEAVWQAKPWQFPFRLSRLTTAAVSAMLVLVITAEAWELGLSQPGSHITILAITALLATTFYVLRRQRLLVRRERNQLTEQSVVTRVSTLSIVFLGMSTTYLLLASTTFVGGYLFFGDDLIANWAPSVHAGNDLAIYGKLSVFVASVGMFIGALGASFEEQYYFRHIMYVDEEI